MNREPNHGLWQASRRSREPPVCHRIEQPNGKAAPLQGLGVARIIPNSRPFVACRAVGPAEADPFAIVNSHTTELRKSGKRFRPPRIGAK